MVCKILKTFWKQHPTKQHLYGHLPPISQNIQVRHAGHCWRNKDELLWTPAHGHASVC